MTCRVASLAAVVLLSFPARALAEPRAERPSVAVALAGDDAPARRVREALSEDPGAPVTVRFVELPNVPPEEVPAFEIESALASARRDYVDAVSARCLEALGGEDVVRDLLGARRRDLAARVVFWRTACTFLGGSPEDALREALAFAVLGLEVPPDVEAATPEVDAILGRALREIAASPRVRLRVSTDVPRASVSVDGRSGVCIAPCAVEVPAGQHLVRIDADGRSPEVRVVRVAGDETSIEVETVPAPPDVAARQWTARYAGSAAIDSASSVRLLALAVRSRRLALLAVDREGSGARMRGVLSVDETVRGRAERRSDRTEDIPDDARDLLHDLLARGGVVEPAPSLVERPVFWIAVGLAAAAAAVGTALFVYDPPTKTEVRF